MQRVFIGIFPSQKIINELKSVQEYIAKYISGRIIETGNIHLTLLFIGGINEKEEKEICLNIDKIAKLTNPFHLLYKSIDFYPNTTNPRILWIKVIEKDRKLEKIHDLLYRLNKKYLKERKNWFFSPHVTLIRIKSIDASKITDIMHRYKEAQHGKDKVDSIYLIRSNLKKSGSTYKIIKKFKLINS